MLFFSIVFLLFYRTSLNITLCEVSSLYNNNIIIITIIIIIIINYYYYYYHYYN